MDFHLRMAFARGWGRGESTLDIFQKAHGLLEFGVFQISISPSAKCPLTFIYRTWAVPPRRDRSAGQLFSESKSVRAGTVLLAHMECYPSSGCVLFKLSVIYCWEFPMVLREWC